MMRITLGQLRQLQEIKQSLFVKGDSNTATRLQVVIDEILMED